MPRRAAVKSTTPTRERILDAAISWFSRHSYEATGLRDIAALAEVDVAYVHRCFGSKKQLFAEAVRAQIRPEELLRESTGDDIAASLAALVFAHDGARDRGEIGPFDIMNHSLSSIEARDIFKGFYHSRDHSTICVQNGGRLSHQGSIADRRLSRGSGYAAKRDRHRTLAGRVRRLAGSLVEGSNCNYPG